MEKAIGTPLQYSCLENPMDGGAWKAAVHGIAEGQTRLSGFTFTFHFHALEKEMATHSNVLAWRIPGTGEPGGLPSMGSHRVGHDWSDLAAAAVKGRKEMCAHGGASRVKKVPLFYLKMKDMRTCLYTDGENLGQWPNLMMYEWERGAALMFWSRWQK